MSELEVGKTVVIKRFNSVKKASITKIVSDTAFICKTTSNPAQIDSYRIELRSRDGKKPRWVATHRNGVPLPQTGMNEILIG